ncbi:phosphodiesterase family protein [Ruminococcus sp. CAG:382]|nr:phosphodiesterase family protein [Ruminococcus sp. CAG:382]
MKFLIASDIHGSAYYCRKLIECYHNENTDRLILLGDILYHGPRNDLPQDYAPKEVIEMLNKLKNEILCVRGNCEAEVDQMVLDFPVLADYALMPLGNRIMFITHGHIFNEQHLPPLKDGDILLHGHTHVPKCVDYGTYTYMNPGSISIPKENSHHGYMTLENDVFRWKDINGNLINEYSLR